jgi:serine protease Do
MLLLATISSFAAGAALAGSGVQVQLPRFSSVQAAESTQHMPSFADVVEKVKPAVISVRVKREAGAKMMSFDGEPSAPDSRMDRFFRRFGMPFGNEGSDNQRQPHNRPVTGEGSGFFISADGYAVTNNHVVDKAKTVEIITDDGKAYSAKVIGTDPRTDIALIKVDGRSDFPFVKLAEQSPRIGGR